MNSSKLLSIQNPGPFLIGLLAGIPYVLATPEVPPAEFPYTYFLSANLIVLIGAVIFTPLRDKQLLKVVLYLELGICAMVLNRAIFDSIVHSPISHNLIPFEFIAAVILTGPGCIAGFLIGLLIRKNSGGKSAQDKSNEPKFIPVLETDSIMDITIIKSVLEAESIEYFIQGENMKYLEPFHQMAILMVVDKDVERVKDILQPIDFRYVRYKGLSY
jgi:hypothetical protein